MYRLPATEPVGQSLPSQPKSSGEIAEVLAGFWLITLAGFAVLTCAVSYLSEDPRYQLFTTSDEPLPSSQIWDAVVRLTAVVYLLLAFLIYAGLTSAIHSKWGRGVLAVAATMSLGTLPNVFASANMLVDSIALVRIPMCIYLVLAPIFAWVFYRDHAKKRNVLPHPRPQVAGYLYRVSVVSVRRLHW